MTGPAGHWPGGPEGEGHGHQGCMPYPAKGGMPPGNPPNGINGENGIMELGLGAGVATGVIEDAPEGVDIRETTRTSTLPIGTFTFTIDPFLTFLSFCLVLEGLFLF